MAEPASQAIPQFADDSQVALHGVLLMQACEGEGKAFVLSAMEGDTGKAAPRHHPLFPGEVVPAIDAESIEHGFDDAPGVLAFDILQEIDDADDERWSASSAGTPTLICSDQTKPAIACRTSSLSKLRLKNAETNLPTQVGLGHREFRVG